MIIPGAILPDTAWFACLGLRLAPEDLADARAYLQALGYADSVQIVPVSGWEQAEAILRSPDWDARWWQREEGERSALMERARAQLGEAATLERLSAAVERDADVIHGAAAIAAARDGGADAALIRCASGAGAMAMHEHALARLAGCGPDHLFMRKYRLFEAGRWPLGVLGERFHLF